MVMFPEASHPAMVSLAASSALQLMTVSEESGNGLYAPVSTFTASLAPALIFNVLLPTRVSGRVEDTTRTVTPAFTVPARMRFAREWTRWCQERHPWWRKPASYRNGTGLR